ncbi:MAG: InlB B-repeat-containing protein [Paludibacteraceae bacterium]|nr:InlB B-repeat-containing protein [Paludibacteraceae bacterium]
MQKIKFFTLAILAMLSANFAWGADLVAYTLTPAEGSNDSYAGNCDVTIDGITWNITGNSKMIPWRLGGKSITNTYRDIYSKTAISDKITKVEVTNGTNSGSISVGEIRLIVSTAQNGGGTVKSTLTTSYSASSTATFACPTGVDWSNCYYKISYKITVSGGSNKYVQFSEANFYKADEPSCTAPTITNDLSETEVVYTKGATANDLSITATGTDVTYQWYSNSSKSTTGATTLTGQTSSSYTPSTTTTGTTYYYCVASSSTCTTTSKFATITVTAPKYTVTFNAGSGTCSTSSSTESTAGAGVNLPVASPSSACGTDGWTFAGWATASQAETTTAPTLYAANSNYKPSSNCTLYAVYSKTESGGGGTPSLVKMAKGGTLADGDKIVIVANGTTVAMYQETTNSSYVNKWTFDNDIETVLGNDKNWLTVTATTDGFTLGDATNGYIYNSSNNLYCGATTVDWELEDLDDGTFKLTTDGRYLSYRSDLSNQYWRMGGASGGTSGQTVLDIYKISASSGTTTYNSNPSCATCSNLINITKGSPSHGSFTLAGAGTDICADEPVTVNLSNITADTHYHATAVTTSATTGGGTPSAITDGSATVSDITASTTINVTFAEDTKVVVTLLNNNNPVNAGGFDAQGKKEYYTGETLGALPTLTSTDACDATSVTFMGWTTEQITTKRAAAPDFVDADTQVNAPMTLRAVWARAQ